MSWYQASSQTKFSLTLGLNRSKQLHSKPPAILDTKNITNKCYILFVSNEICSMQRAKKGPKIPEVMLIGKHPVCALY